MGTGASQHPGGLGQGRMEALTAPAGPPCENGYLRTVTVTLIRDPANPYDGFRAEVEGRHVGHLARHLAAQLAPPLDACGCGPLRGLRPIARRIAPGSERWRSGAASGFEKRPELDSNQRPTP